MSKRGQESAALLGINDSVERPPLTKPLVFALFAALGPLAFGYVMGYTSPVGKDLTKSTDDNGLGISDDENSLFSSIVTVGAMIGALSGGVLADKLGRVWTIRIACLPFVGGFILISFAKSFGMLIAGRILSGVGVGIVSLAVPVFIAEIAPTEYRGALGAINQLAITIGIVIVYSLGLLADWRELSWMGSFIPGGLFLLSFLLPETPNWLIVHNRTESAKTTLRRLRGPDFNVDAELSQILSQQSSSSSEPVALSELFQGASKRAMFVGICLMLFQQFSGVNDVFFYAGQIFTDAGVSNANAAALSIAAVQVVITGVACVLVDRAGRRVLLILAGLGMSASCAILGYYFYRQDHGADIPGILAVLMLIIYVIFFSIGLGAVPWLMMGEIFPSRVRGLASSLATLINWGSAFAVTETFDYMKSAFTPAGVFWFFSAVCIIGVLFVLSYCPETKGRSLEQIEAYFNGDHSSIPPDRNGAALVKVTGLACLLVVGIVVLSTSI